MGWAINTFSLGRTVNVRDTEGLGHALTVGLDDAPGFALNEAARRFVAFHSAGNFALTWTRRIRARLGLPAQSALQTWEWVTSALPSGRAPASA